MARLLLRPDVRRGAAYNHSGAVDGLRQHERQPDAHHVGVVGADPLEAADPDVVAQQHHEGAEDAEDDGEDAGRARDRERRVGDRDRDRAPGRDRGRRERARVRVDVDDARVRGREELEHGRGEENGDDGTDALCEPLLVWRCAQKESGSEVAG